LQEKILRAISKERRSEPNMTCVGDVKQSIYRFRMAKPDLFIEKYSSYKTGDDEKFQRITLDKNFRSREQVIKTVNEVFKNTMKKSIGGVEYDRDNYLYFEAKYQEIPKGQDNTTEIIIAESQKRTEKN
jgi:ATP-dependent helicase/nuclease subunit A